MRDIVILGGWLILSLIGIGMPVLGIAIHQGSETQARIAKPQFMRTKDLPREMKLDLLIREVEGLNTRMDHLEK